VTLYRELAQSNPDQYRPVLAASLIVLGQILSVLGDSVEAARVIEEAKRIQGDSSES